MSDEMSDMVQLATTIVVCNASYDFGVYGPTHVATSGHNKSLFLVISCCHSCLRSNDFTVRCGLCIFNILPMRVVNTTI